MSEDLVNHPPHYTKGKIEVIDFLEDQKLDFRLCNVIKYICRAEHKGTKEADLKKAKWYLDRYISSEFDKNMEYDGLGCLTASKSGTITPMPPSYRYGDKF